MAPCRSGLSQVRLIPLSRRQCWGNGGDVTNNRPLPGTPVLQVLAKDADDTVSSTNGVVVYSILRQRPDHPQPHMFAINSITGVISVAAAGLVAQVSPEHSPCHPPTLFGGDTASRCRWSLNTPWTSRRPIWKGMGCRPLPPCSSKCR